MMRLHELRLVSSSISCFLNTLIYNTSLFVKQRTICSKTHNLLTVETERMGLSSLDIKRYVLDDGIRTLAYGHYQINKCG